MHPLAWDTDGELFGVGGAISLLLTGVKIGRTPRQPPNSGLCILLPPTPTRQRRSLEAVGLGVSSIPKSAVNSGQTMSRGSLGSTD